MPRAKKVIDESGQAAPKKRRARQPKASSQIAPKSQNSGEGASLSSTQIIATDNLMEPVVQEEAGPVHSPQSPLEAFSKPIAEGNLPGERSPASPTQFITTTTCAECVGQEDAGPASNSLSPVPANFEQMWSEFIANPCIPNATNVTEFAHPEPAIVSEDHAISSSSQRNDDQNLSPNHSTPPVRDTPDSSIMPSPLTYDDLTDDILDGFQLHEPYHYEIEVDQICLLYVLKSGKGMVPVDFLYHVFHKKQALQDKVKSLDGELHDAQVRASELMQHVEELAHAKQLAAKLEQRVEAQQQDLVAVRSERDALSASYRAAQSECESLRGSKQSQKEDLDKAQRDLRAMQRSLEKANQDRDEIAKQHETMTRDHDNVLETKTAVLAEELETLRREKSRLEELVATAEASRDVHKENSEAHKKEVARLQEQLKSLAEKLAASNKSLSDLKDECAAAKTSQNLATNSLKNLQDEDEAKLAELNSEVVDLTTKLEGKDAAIENMKKADRLLRDAIRDCHKLVVDDKHDQARLSTESSTMLTAITLKMKELSSQVASEADEYEPADITHAQEIEQLNDKITELHRQLAAGRVTNERLNDQIAELHRQLAVSRVTDQRANSAPSGVLTEKDVSFARLRNEVSELTRLLASTREHLEKSMSKNDDLEQKVTELDAQSKQLMSHNLALANDNTRIYNDFIQMRNQRDLSNTLLQPLMHRAGVFGLHSEAVCAPGSAEQTSHFDNGDNPPIQQPSLPQLPQRSSTEVSQSHKLRNNVQQKGSNSYIAKVLPEVTHEVAPKPLSSQPSLTQNSQEPVPRPGLSELAQTTAQASSEPSRPALTGTALPNAAPLSLSATAKLEPAQQQTCDLLKPRSILSNLHLRL